MRYVLTLEAIGDSHTQAIRAYEGFYNRLGGGQLAPFGSSAPWVAALVLVNDRLERHFVRGNKDYSGASGSGNRGIVLYYPLRSGVYEVNERLSWRRSRRYFLRVIDSSTAEELSQHEAMRHVHNENGS